jgi:hypothetical protein
VLVLAMSAAGCGRRAVPAGGDESRIDRGAERGDAGALRTDRDGGAECPARPLARGWTQIPTGTAPPAGQHAAYAYDSLRGRVVLFGGRSTEHVGSYYSTWEWRCGWTEVTPSVSPDVDSWCGAMSYDSLRDRMVLVGFYTDETWEWNPGARTWALVQAGGVGPRKRQGPGLAYDARRGRTVLFGGFDNDGGTNLHDTWEWDGKAWVEMHPKTSPSDRSAPAMTWDSRRERVVMHTAFAGTGKDPDLWEWDGVNWSELVPASGEKPRYDANPAITYDPTGGRILAFGSATTNAVWIWDGATWTEDYVGGGPKPQGRAYGVWVYDLAASAVFSGLGFSNDPSVPSNTSFHDAWYYVPP